MKKKAQLATLTIIFALLVPTALLLTPNQPFTSIPITTPPQTKTNSIPPQDAPPWWNTTFKYRIAVNITDTRGVTATIPVDLYINFTQLGYTCHKDSIRVQYWNGSSWLPEPGLPYQIWNQTLNGDNIQTATITFYANLTPHQTTTYYIYFNDQEVESPSFTPQITVTETTDSITITGNEYKAYIYKSSNGGKIYESFNIYYGENWSLAPFHNNPTLKANLYRSLFGIFTPELVGERRWTTDGAPSAGPSLTASGPIFAVITLNVNFTLSSDVRAQANITYRFFSWGWICKTNTTFTNNFPPPSYWSGLYYYYYDEAVYESCGWSFVPQVMPKLVYKTAGIRKDISLSSPGCNLGQAEWFCTLDETYGTAAGIIPLGLPQFSIQNPPSSWYFMVRYDSNSERFYRSTSQGISAVAGNWISEEYAFYVWNGTRGSTSFESFAEGVLGKSISLGVVEERFYTVTVQVQDLDSLPVSGALVRINATDGSSLLSATTDNDGKATFYLYQGPYNISVIYNETHEGTTYQQYSKSTGSHC